MEKIEIMEKTIIRAADVWADMQHAYPTLKKHRCPDVVFNNRLWRTAGLAHQEDFVIELGTKFLMHSIEYRAIMLGEILVHELAHVADFWVFGESELACGHGKGWCSIMRKMCLEPKKFHDMNIPRKTVV